MAASALLAQELAERLSAWALARAALPKKAAVAAELQRLCSNSKPGCDTSAAADAPVEPDGDAVSCDSGEDSDGQPSVADASDRDDTAPVAAGKTAGVSPERPTITQASSALQVTLAEALAVPLRAQTIVQACAALSRHLVRTSVLIFLRMCLARHTLPSIAMYK